MTNDETAQPLVESRPIRHSSFASLRSPLRGSLRLAVSLRSAVIRICLLAILVGCAAKPAPHPDEANIRAFLTRYFSTWSAKDMEGYAACFHPQARILFLDRSGEVVSEGVSDFLHGQRMAHESASAPMTEEPVEMVIQGDAKAAQAQVTWVLRKGGTEERGTDLFTLKREGGGWKIVSLVFYGE